MKKATTQAMNDSSFSLDKKKPNSNKRKTQKEKTLEAFLLAGEFGFYQITAYKTFQTTCLHTVVSNFQKEGLMFNRKTIMHLNLDGGKTAFTLYWLADGKAEVLAVCLLNALRFKRGLEPIIPGQYLALTRQAA